MYVIWGRLDVGVCFPGLGFPQCIIILEISTTIFFCQYDSSVDVPDCVFFGNPLCSSPAIALMLSVLDPSSAFFQFPLY